MKKKLLLGMLLLFSMCFFTGCVEEGNEQPSSESTTITTSSYKEDTEEEDSGISQDSFSVQSTKEPKDNSQKGKLLVHYLDVGQGDCTLIQYGSHCMLIDGGNDAMGTRVQLYLQKQGIETLDYVIGTHKDSDHIGGLDVIVYKFDCDTILFPDYNKNNKQYEELKGAMKEKGYQFTTPRVGDTYQFGPSTFTILSPKGGDYKDSNDYSIALRLQYGNNSFLFTGDAGEEIEADMMASGEELASDVYKVAHHGSKYASSLSFLKRVSPTYAVISCGENNSYGHPSGKVLNYLRQQKVKVFRTDEQGTIVATSDGKNITFNCSESTSWQAGEQTQAESTENNKNNKEETNYYILNTNTKKYHKESCSSVKTIKENHKKKVKQSKDALEKQGYTPCKRCNP